MLPETLIEDFVTYISETGRICQNFNGKVFAQAKDGRFKGNYTYMSIYVYETLVGTIGEHYKISHIDGDLSNNRPDNLIKLPRSSSRPKDLRDDLLHNEELTVYRNALGIKCQNFNGKVYRRSAGSKYYSRGKNDVLHRAVWEFHNGKIPLKYHIHHLDNNSDNNFLNNLQLLSGFEHISLHSKKLHNSDPDRLNRIRPSTEIRVAASREFWKNKAYVSYTCEVCGKVFEARSQVKVMYCSSMCNTRAYRIRKQLKSK